MPRRRSIESIADFTALHLIQEGAAGVTDDDLPIDVGAFTLETPSAEIVRVIEDTLWLDIIETMEAHFFGDGGWIFAEITCNFLEGESLIQEIFNKGSGHLTSDASGFWELILTYGFLLLPLPCGCKRKIPQIYEKLNST